MERRVGVGVRKGVRRIRLDGRDERSAAAVAQVVPVSLLVPQSHGILDRGPGYRRRLLDWGVFHVEPEYGAEARTYARALAQRNSALKEGGKDATTWEGVLAEHGDRIQERRLGYLHELNGALASVSKNLLGEDVIVELDRGWSARKMGLRDALEYSRSLDRRRGYTTVGPHRADLLITLGGRRAERFASRGQQKLVIAAIVLAQASVAQRKRQGDMVLLVDDFAAELDPQSRKAFWGQIRSAECQTLITAIDVKDLPEPEGVRVFHVEHGVLIPL